MPDHWQILCWQLLSVLYRLKKCLTRPILVRLIKKYQDNYGEDHRHLLAWDCTCWLAQWGIKALYRVSTCHILNEIMYETFSFANSLSKCCFLSMSHKIVFDQLTLCISQSLKQIKYVRVIMIRDNLTLLMLKMHFLHLCWWVVSWN